MNTEHTHYHEEAECVVWTAINYSGFELNVTARQGASKELILDTCRELVKALAELEKAGATPVVKSYHNGNGNGSKAANAALATAATPHDPFDELPSATQDPAVQQALAKAKANGYPPAAQAGRPAPAAQPAAVLANGAEDPGYCKIHRCAMKRHEKNGEAWYSHKAPDGSWCRGKYDPPSMGY